MADRREEDVPRTLDRIRDLAAEILENLNRSRAPQTGQGPAAPGTVGEVVKDAAQKAAREMSGKGEGGGKGSDVPPPLPRKAPTAEAMEQKAMEAAGGLGKPPSPHPTGWQEPPDPYSKAGGQQYNVPLMLNFHQQLAQAQQSHANAPLPVRAARAAGSHLGSLFGKYGIGPQEAASAAGKLSGNSQGAQSAMGLGLDVARAAAGDPSAVASLVQKAAQEVQERIKAVQQAGAEMGQAMSTDRAGQAASHGFAAGERLARSFEGPFGGPVSKVMEFGKAVADSVEKLRDLSRGLHDSNMRFAEVSAAMAGVQARQEVREIQLSQERGARRADSAEYLAEGMQRLEKALAPLEDRWANFTNRLFGYFDNQVAKVAENVEANVKLLEDLARKLGILVDKGNEGKPGQLASWMDETAKNDWTKTYGRPPRFGPPA